jgi:hypothetical protein
MGVRFVIFIRERRQTTISPKPKPV